MHHIHKVCKEAFLEFSSLKSLPKPVLSEIISNFLFDFSVVRLVHSSVISICLDELFFYHFNVSFFWIVRAKKEEWNVNIKYTRS